jgi:hypothetical protein
VRRGGCTGVDRITLRRPVRAALPGLGLVIAAQKLLLLLRARAILIASSVLLVGPAVRLALSRASVPGLTVPRTTAALHAMAMHP